MMLYFALALSAFAEKLVVIESEDLLGTATEMYRESSVILSWSEVQQYPLLFSNADVLGDCSVYPKKISDVETALNNVTAALDYMELEKADGHLLRVESNLRCLDEPVSPELLAKIYFISGLTHFYREEKEKTVEQWKQAYIFDATLGWDDQFEPSGKPLFEETLSDLKLTAQSTIVIFPSTAAINVDGHLRNTSSNIDSGKHLVQHGSPIQSYLIEVGEAQDFQIVSFRDFPEELSVVMQNEQKRAELAKALQLGMDYSDYAVLTKDHQWTILPNSTNWRSIPLDDKRKSVAASSSDLGNKRNLPLLYASVGTATLSALSFYLAGQKYTEFMTTIEEAEAIKNQNNAYFFTGIGLGVVTGGLVIAGVKKW